MADNEFEYKATLDDKQILNVLKRIDKNIEKLANEADKDFKKVQKSVDLSGVKIGAVSGIVSSLTTEFINLGRQAVTALIDVSKQAVTVAQDFDTLRARLLGIFDGSEQAADQAFSFIQEKSRELGLDLGELAGAFLPKVESLEQFEEVAKIAAALAKSDPEQGAIGARIALIEALSGTFTSLQRRFEIGTAEIDKLKEAFDTQGVQGFIDTLNQVLADSGKSFEDLSDTATTTFAKAQTSVQQLLGVAGDPILEQLKETFDEIFQIIENNRDDFELVATAIGQVVAHIVDFVGTNFADYLANLDTEQILKIVGYFNEMISTADALIKVLSEAEIGDALLNGVEALVRGLRDALQTATIIAGFAKAEIARQKAEAEALQELVEQGRGVTSFLGFNIPTEEGEAIAAAAGQEAFNQSILDTDEILKQINLDTEEYNLKLDKFVEKQKKANQAATDTADAFLEQSAATRALEESLTETLEELDKFAEKVGEIEQDLADKLLEIAIKSEERRLEILLDGAQEREDIARKNAQAIEDIYRDFARDARDADIEAGRDRADIESDLADKLIDIEVAYRRRIQDIQRRFQESAEEAERSRDAVAFLRAQRQRDRDIQAAGIDRTRDVQDAQKAAERKREELAKEQQREKEDAEQHLEDKLEDQRIANERELEEQKIKENRKLEEQKRAEQQQIEAAERAAQQKLEALIGGLSEELQQTLNFEKGKTEITIAEANARIAALQAELEQRKAIAAEMAAIEATSMAADASSSGGGSQPVPAPVSPFPQQIPGFQQGGEFRVKRISPGGADSQLVQFMATPGELVSVTPPRLTNPLNRPNINNAISNVINTTVNQSMLDPSQQSAIMRQIARNEAVNVIKGVLGK